MNTRINFDSERRMDSLAMVLLLMDEHSIKAPAQFDAALDELGVRLLGFIKEQLGWSTTQMQVALIARDEKMRAGNLVRIGVKPEDAARMAGTICAEDAHDWVGSGDAYYICQRCGTVKR